MIEIFIDYYVVINDLKNNPNDKSLRYRYDYTSILLLDSSQMKLIKSVRPDVIKEFRDCSPG